ncbi:uncharacterized protein TM35_000591140 [Trypanosoma theileri]|uniref:Uncharacterized protein n=1 Tax=Trypanosoma theileri TaxID=67003 RepID=A0A1X0NG66_9TRYP|nr:uncharacterized protein TM35_000591140 [Trypanosoma theileri]ORC83722.1 hypothetical protein TM35_000591140 [Trypanosoma theileri]
MKRGAVRAPSVLLLLQDSCSALAVCVLVHKHQRSRQTRNRIADCVCRTLSTHATLPLSTAVTTTTTTATISSSSSSSSTSAISSSNDIKNSTRLVYIGVATGVFSATTVARCYTLLPSPGRLFVDYCLSWARHAQSEQTRQYIASQRMAVLQTMGGGWASLRRADKALRCALLLYYTALQLHDASTQRKCRVFVGWAHLWNGDVRRAVEIFKQQQEEAREVGDTVQELRCSAALHHAEYNPTVVRSHGGFSLASCWTDIFA